MNSKQPKSEPVSSAEYVDRLLTPSWLRGSGDAAADHDRKNREQAITTAVNIITS
jgi:hypothetical protein